MMELNILRDEIRKLSTLVDGWDASDAIPEIERELVLEKLRVLYDAVKFGPGKSKAVDPAGEFVPAEIDLAGMLALDPFSLVEPEPEYPPVSEAGPVVSESSFSEREPESVSSDPAVGEHLIPDDRLPKIPSEQTPETIAPVPAESDPEPVATTPDFGVSAVAESDSVSVASDPGSDPKSAFESVSEPLTVATSSEPAVSASSAPTLFGMEEVTVRHRHRQRVIMSLYGAEPAVPAVEERLAHAPAVPAPEEFVGEPFRSDSDAERSAESERVLPDPVPVAASAEDSAVSEPAFAEDRPVETADAASEAPLSAMERLAAVSAESEEPDAADFSTAEAVLSASEPGKQTELAAPAVLGEVINSDVQTLADAIAPRRDLASELGRSEPVGDLRRAIGINDKFLMIRDLFCGDAAAYEAAIDALNGFGDFDECMIWIAEHYAWNSNSDGAKFLMELLERKFA